MWFVALIVHNLTRLRPMIYYMLTYILYINFYYRQLYIYFEQIWWKVIQWYKSKFDPRFGEIYLYRSQFLQYYIRL